MRAMSLTLMYEAPRIWLGFFFATIVGWPFLEKAYLDEGTEIIERVQKCAALFFFNESMVATSD